MAKLALSDRDRDAKDDRDDRDGRENGASGDDRKGTRLHPRLRMRAC